MPWLLRMTLFVSLLMLPALLYLTWRLYVSVKQLSVSTRISNWIIPFILCSFYAFPIAGMLDFYLTEHIDVLKYPKLLTYWFWFGLIFVFQLATWALILDLVKLCSWLLSWHKKTIGRVHAYLLVVLFGLIFVYSGWKVYHDTTQIAKEELVLQIENLPEAWEGLKIVHISDIQGDEYTGESEIAQYVRKVNKQNPDVVIFTGDLVSYGTDFIQMSAEELGKTEANYGTYAVVGDHDFWAGTEHIEKALTEAGIHLLQDENDVIFTDHSSSLLLTGITEVYSKQSSPEEVDSLASYAEEAAIKIMVSHQVDEHLIESSQKYGYDLMLAGHTHGGQIQVPFLGMDFSAAARETKYVSGLYREDGLPINVNNGLGFTLGPIRYNAQPTITVIELQNTK